MDDEAQCEPGEQELRVVRQSKSRLIIDILSITLGLTLIGLLVIVATKIVWPVLAILFAIALLVGYAAYLNWHSTVYIITSVRIESKSGVISRVAEEICFEDIQSIDTQQNLIGRILAHGDIKIEAAGQNVITLKNVHHAHRLAHEITNLSLKYNKDKLKIPDKEKIFSTPV